MVMQVDGERVQNGAELVLCERGLFQEGMLLPAIRAALSLCSDFSSEKPLVQKAIEAAGQCVHWLPKYHSPCNASEYFGGNGKKRFRIECDFSMKGLKRDGMRTLYGIDPRTARKFIRKAREYDRALMAGCDAFSMGDRVQTYKKEREYEATSKQLDVRRGVVQGDIFSPVCFIIALECLMRRSDKDGGVTVLGVLLSRLEFADDAALIDESIDKASERISSIAKGLRELIYLRTWRSATTRRRRCSRGMMRAGGK